MQIFSWKDIVNIASATVLVPTVFNKAVAMSIGSFDGPHLGHKKLFTSVLNSGLVSGLLTFTKSLRGYKDPTHYAGDIATLKQRLSFFEQMGFAFIILVDFSYDFGRIEGEEFFKILRKACNLKLLVEGQDFSCGYKGATSVKEIKQFCTKLDFAIDIEDSMQFEGEKISSSRIRDCIKVGDFSRASAMLGRQFLYDCTDLSWHSYTDICGFILEANRTALQILCDCDNKEVQLLLCEKQQKALMSVKANTIRLQTATKVDGDMITAIQFM